MRGRPKNKTKYTNANEAFELSNDFARRDKGYDELVETINFCLEAESMMWDRRTSFCFSDGSLRDERRRNFLTLALQDAGYTVTPTQYADVRSLTIQWAGIPADFRPRGKVVPAIVIRDRGVVFENKMKTYSEIMRHITFRLRATARQYDAKFRVLYSDPGLTQRPIRYAVVRKFSVDLGFRVLVEKIEDVHFSLVLGWE
jgi:hypothetical protein